MAERRVGIEQLERGHRIRWVDDAVPLIYRIVNVVPLAGDSSGHYDVWAVPDHGGDSRLLMGDAPGGMIVVRIITDVADHVDPERLVEWVGAQWARAEVGLPSEWDQTIWLQNDKCGTVGCIAGKTVLMAGYKPALVRLFDDDVSIDGEHVVHPDDDPFKERNWRGVPGLAGQLLGLDLVERAELFGGDKTIDQVLAFLASVIKRRS